MHLKPEVEKFCAVGDVDHKMISVKKNLNKMHGCCRTKASEQKPKGEIVFGLGSAVLDINKVCLPANLCSLLTGWNNCFRNRELLQK